MVDSTKNQEIQIVPFPSDKLYLAWEWLNEYPEANFDDYGPQDYASFKQEMLSRYQSEAIFGVKYCGELVGIVGYHPISTTHGNMHGVCFAKKVHRTGVAFAAIRAIFLRIFSAGVEKISIMYFTYNWRIHKLFKKLGVVKEGYLKNHTIKNGKPQDMLLMALFKGHFSCH